MKPIYLIGSLLILFCLVGCAPTQKKVLHDPSVSLGQKVQAFLYRGHAKEIEQKKKMAAYEKENKRLEKEVNKGVPKKNWFESTNTGLKQVLKQRKKQAKKAKKRKERKAKRAAYLKSHPKVAAQVRAKKLAYQKCFLASEAASGAASERDVGISPQNAYQNMLSVGMETDHGWKIIKPSVAKRVVNWAYFNPQAQELSSSQILNGGLYNCDHPDVKHWHPVR